VGNSGLLDGLLPTFQQEYGVTVRTHLVGSGLALKMLADGDADVVISHAPDMESAALGVHATWQYQKIMFNDFVLVGPTSDAAHVREATDVRDAMPRVAQSSERFLSRGDQSGTHEREQRLWRLAGAMPEGNRLAVAGAGMGTTLQIAGEMGAYSLTDRATFAQHARTVPLVVVFEGGPDLLNTYAVIVDPSGPNASQANVLADWLATGEGRALIDGFRIGHEHVFHPWPPKRPGSSPSDTPD
jgi:tungstate transport system substrate-binding protein